MGIAASPSKAANGCRALIGPAERGDPVVLAQPVCQRVLRQAACARRPRRPLSLAGQWSSNPKDRSPDVGIPPRRSIVS